MSAFSAGIVIGAAGMFALLLLCVAVASVVGRFLRNADGDA